MLNQNLIVFVHHCATRSGAANSLLALLKNLDSKKFKSIVLCPQGTAAEAFRETTEVLTIPNLPEISTVSGSSTNYLRLLKTAMLYKNLNTVISLIESLKPDLVHLNELSLTPLAKRLKKRKIKVVIHARLVLNRNTKLLNSWIIHRLKKYSDMVICIDGSVKNSLRNINHSSIVYNSYQFSETDLHVIPNFPKERFIVLFLANLIKYKGIFDLVEAAKKLKNYNNIEIWIAGGNSRPDYFFRTFTGRLLNLLGLVTNNKKTLQCMISDNELRNVRLLGSISNIRKLIMESSLLIFPSYMNGPSRSIFEAGIFGKPSIISLKDKIQDIVENEVTGLIIDERSPEQIKTAILKLYNDPEKLKRMGENAKMKYLEINNPYRNIHLVEHIYHSLLKKPI